MTERYRDWPIEILPGHHPRAIIHPMDGSAGIRLERDTEPELFQAAVELIDQLLIDEHVPMVSREIWADEFIEDRLGDVGPCGADSRRQAFPDQGSAPTELGPGAEAPKLAAA